MRLRAPRIAPLDPAMLDNEQVEALAPVMREGAEPLNIFLTLAHAPDALAAFLGWGNYVLSRRNALTPRQRELAILRTGFNCGSGYEFAQHSAIGLRSGISREEIEALKAGPGAGQWSALEHAILTACDQLHHDQFVADSTWAALAELGDKGRMDLVFTVGQYTQVSMMLNSFGVQLEGDQQPDPELDRR
ncbi:carboxymuconolactone decarboxylase [Tsuneonella deserti]|uniref:Carboxymuconolactone decarboxylase n=1 Tax=Tsuneonella deserti TaxID=2035528 RepID=A0ABQ1S9Y6_9SPHN|nr:carboxymuconolactone decarboxylase family protein [Tsuneonella deserti]GGE02449.1 carboxymuconolactone decarboxylase [Tsuneonella deserti]